MELNSNSKLKDALQHPIGRSILENLLYRYNKDMNKSKKSFSSRMPLYKLDDLCGTGFVDKFLELINREQDFAALDEVYTEPTWWKEAVIYQVYLPSFMDADHDGIGDFMGVVQRLPYLQKLGVDTLWLLPVVQTEVSGERACIDFTTPINEFGSIEDFELLVDTAHERGMRVVIGLDIEMTSEKHSWFQAALAGDEKYKNYYIIQEGEKDRLPNNWGRNGTGWKWYAEQGFWALQWLGPGRMDLNWENPEVRLEMANILNFWKEKGVDGFCLGSANLLGKPVLENGFEAVVGKLGAVGYEQIAYTPLNHSFLKELRKRVDCEKEMLFIAEIYSVTPDIAKLYTREDGTEMDLVFDIAHLMGDGRIKDVEIDTVQLSLRGLKDYYLQWLEEYGNERWLLIVCENSGLPRIINRFGANPIYRNILAKAIVTMQLTFRGTPLLYQGQELGLPNTKYLSIANTKVSAAFAKVPMPWNVGLNGGFSGATPWCPVIEGIDRLNVSTQMEDEKSVLNYCKKLISMRKKYAALRYGEFKPVFVKNKNLFCYFRILENEKWYIEINLTEKVVRRAGDILATQHLVLSNYDDLANNLRPYEANIYRCE